MNTIGIRVSGKVQGVFFRQATKEKANELGICGRVRNEENGDVFILASGKAHQLDQLVDWCRKGPPRARVTGVERVELPLQEFQDFAVDR